MCHFIVYSVRDIFVYPNISCVALMQMVFMFCVMFFSADYKQIYLNVKNMFLINEAVMTLIFCDISFASRILEIYPEF